MSPTTTVQDTSNESFVDKKMEQAYGAKLIKCVHDGVVYSNAKQYDLPGGAVGREFVELLKDEVADGKEVSEILIYALLCCCCIEITWSRKVAHDIRRLLARRMNLWRTEV